MAALAEHFLHLLPAEGTPLAVLVFGGLTADLEAITGILPTRTSLKNSKLALLRARRRSRHSWHPLFGALLGTVFSEILNRLQPAIQKKNAHLYNCIAKRYCKGGVVHSQSFIRS
jgi:hypothetical protein